MARPRRCIAGGRLSEAFPGQCRPGTARRAGLRRRASCPANRRRPRGVRGADALAFDGGDPRLRLRRRREGGRGAWRRRRAYRFRRARAARRGDRERGGVLMPLSEALEKWHDFYLLLGTGAAALVALLFVAVSLGAGFLNEERAEATRTFFSPVVVHFSAVFF